MNIPFLKPLKGLQEGRLITIDALRGIAALAVVIFHITYYPTAAFNFHALPFEKVKWIFTFIGGQGRSGVWLFFVISGFCIHMKWARGHAKGDDTPPAFIPFWKRRMLRLYPAYAAAIVFSIVVFGLSGQIRFDLKFIYDIVMHFLLIHNLDMSTTFTISAPLWSLAVEEQLYLLYFILLRMRMKWGWGKTLFVTLGCRAVWMAIGYIAHHKFGLKYFAYDFGIAFWFMWALGAVSVEAWQGTLQLPAWTKNISVGMVLWCLAVGNECFSNLYALPVSIWFQRACEFVEQPLWALAYFVLLNWALQKEEKWKLQDRISRIAQGAALAGVFSYSIYLIHSPIVDNKSEWIIGLADYSFNSDVLMRFIFMVPLAIIVARIFFELFERPFLKEQK